MKTSKVDANIKIELVYQDAVLKQAGYKKHNTIYEGKMKFGYIRDMEYDKRFHCHMIDDNLMTLHVDKTKNGRHIVMNNYYRKFLDKEAKRIRKIYKNMLPRGRSVENKRTHKDQYAPNLIELQRNHKTNVRVVSLLDKILQLIKKL